jgi:hypothetical protein
MSSDETSGDAADQADATIAAAEQEAIAAALAGRDIEQDRADAARPDRVGDEPALDFGDGDDSDDPAHDGGDDVATTSTGAPEEPAVEEARTVVDEDEDEADDREGSALIDE